MCRPTRCGGSDGDGISDILGAFAGNLHANEDWQLPLAGRPSLRVARLAGERERGYSPAEVSLRDSFPVVVSVLVASLSGCAPKSDVPEFTPESGEYAVIYSHASVEPSGCFGVDKSDLEGTETLSVTTGPLEFIDTAYDTCTMNDDWSFDCSSHSAAEGDNSLGHWANEYAYTLAGAWSTATLFRATETGDFTCTGSGCSYGDQCLISLLWDGDKG